MQISFANRQVRELCELNQAALRELGQAGARRLQARLADLEASSDVRNLVAGHPHPLQGDRAGQFALDLNGGRRLVFEPDQVPAPQLAGGGIDWAAVTAIRIVFIGDYHD